MCQKAMWCYNLLYIFEDNEYVLPNKSLTRIACDIHVNKRSQYR